MILSKILIFVAILAAIYLTIALVLVASARPQAHVTGDTLQFDRISGRAVGLPKVETIALPGGWSMPYRRFGAGQDGAPLVVIVHGSGWYGAGYAGLAHDLAAKGAEVLLPDLRGHGPTPQRRGDVDYIGQMEDDLAALIAANGDKARKVVMVGHSSGGGLVIRFAGGKHGSMLDGAVLLAPFLKYNAPTARDNSGGWAHPLTRRLIGLSMLNTIGIRALNGLKVIQFALPDSVRNGPGGDAATTAYSYRLNTGFAPRADYLKDVAALPPFLLIAGNQDEAFVATAYQPTMAAVTDKGTYHLLAGAGHLDLYDDPRAIRLAADFIASIAD